MSEKLRNKQILVDASFDMNSQKIIAAANAVDGTDVPNLAQVEALIAGLEWQDSVIADVQYTKTTAGAPSSTGATTGELCLNTSDKKLYTSTSGDTWDAGVALTSGDRYIHKENGTGTAAGTNPTADNNIYDYNGTTVDSVSPTAGTFVAVDDDTTNLWLYGGASWSSKSFEITTVADTTTIDLTISGSGEITGALIVNTIDETYLKGLGTGVTNDLVASDNAGGFTYINSSTIANRTPQRTSNPASVTASNEDDAVSDIFGANAPASDSIPRIFVNGSFVQVKEDKTGSCYFAETGAPETAIAFASLSGDEDLQWNGSIAGYQLDATDTVVCEFES